jgi:hypothetical protein
LPLDVKEGLSGVIYRGNVLLAVERFDRREKPQF